jgi:predicted negative regulator of RcsB-dependent stress response
MSPRSEVVFCLFLLFAFTLTASAQRGQSPAPPSASPTSSTPAGAASEMSGVPMHGTGGNGSVQVSVVDDKNARLDRVAVVKLSQEGTKFTTWQPEKNGPVTFDELGPGKYEFEVSALGYLTSKKDFELNNASKPVHLDVVLRADPDAVEFSGADPSLSSKAAKETEKGITDLKAGNMKDAQKHLENAVKDSPTSAHANFLAGYACFQQNNVDQAQTYLAKAVSLDPHQVEALNLQGRIDLSKKDYAAAKTTMEQAVAAAPDNGTSHALLADVYLNDKDYKNALAQADLALDKGKSHASNAQIVRGQALANTGHTDDAIAALKLYLESAPDSTAAPQVKQWIDILQQRAANAPAAQPAKQ